MRPTMPALLLLVLAAACRTAPQQAPVETAPPPAPPLSIGALVPQTGSLKDASVRLEGLVGPALEGTRSLSWRASWNERTLGEGTAAIHPDGEGRFDASLPLRFGASLEDLQAFQGSEVLEVVLTVSAGDGERRVESQRAVAVRSPRLPEVKMLTVQASRRGSNALGLVYIVAVKNPNPFEVRLGILEYTASLGESAFAKEDLPLAMKIPASGENSFEIPASATVDNVGREFSAMLRRGQFPWSFAGTVTVNGLRIPFELGGEIRLSTGG